MGRIGVMRNLGYWEVFCWGCLMIVLIGLYVGGVRMDFKLRDCLKVLWLVFLL